jgi:photosystem II stability/assembly factor-like uncharacterized protein
VKKTLVFFLALAVALSSCFIISAPGNNTAKAVEPLEWTQVNNGFVYHGIRSLAIDPNDTRVVYAGTNYEGVYKTTTGGTLWIAVNSGLTDLYVRSLAIDPNDTQVVYAGTSLFVFKSTDGGNLWIRMNNGLVNKDVSCLAIDPTDTQVVYAGTTSGGPGSWILKSTTGGSLWTPMDNGFMNSNVYSLAIDPTNTQVIYAATSKGVFKSTNGASSWGLTALTYASTNTYFHSLAIDPNDTQVFYSGAEDGYVYKSPDGGSSWTQSGVTTGTPDILSLAIDPTNTQVIYAGASSSSYGGVFKSTDGGSSWTSAGLTYPYVHCLAMDPTDTQVIYAGTTYGGVFKSTAVSSSDLGMHITSPLEGATLTGSTFAVSGTFDTPHSGNFNLVVTIPGVGTHIYPFTVLTAATTWGPVSISRADFPDLVSGETYGLTLVGTTQLPTIPPLQTAVRTVSWQVPETVSYPLSLLPSWNVISVPFPTPVGLLPTCDLFLWWDGSLWQSVTTLLPGTGYLVRNTVGATTVTLTGLPSSSPQTQPATGTWQIIGNPYTTPASFACTSSVPYLLWWDGSFWQLASPTNLPPGLGFLLQASSPGTITLTRLP